MWWVVVCWLLLSVVGAAVFSMVRRRCQPVTIPREVQQFLRQLDEDLRQHHPGAELRGMVPGRFAAVLAVHGQEFPVSLHHLFRRCSAFPERFSDAVGRFIEELERDGLEEPADHEFADAAPHVLPQIRSVEWLAEHGGAFGAGALVQRKFTDDLVICYVIDDEWCMTFVCQTHLRQWGRTEEDLFHLATRNLHRSACTDVPVPEPDGEPLLLRTGDGFDAARVLLLDPDRVEGLLVGVPERDLLWLGNDAGEDMASLMSMNEQQSNESAHPVSTQLYRMTSGQLVPVSRSDSAD